MPVTVRCEQCGHTYGAPDSFAGKKVRCRHCGKIVAIPSKAAAPSTPAIAQPKPAETNPAQPVVASPGVLADKPRDIPAVPAEESEGELHLDDIHEEDDGPEVLVESLPLRPVLPGNSRYDFPGAKTLDMLLPWVLVLGGMLWIVLQAGATGTPHYPDIGYLRAAIYILSYSLIVFPLTLLAVTIGVRRARFGLPDFGAWRVYASFFPALVLSVVLWLVTDLRDSFITGFCVGFVLSLGAFWMLLRLLPYQARVMAWAAAGFLIGSFITISLLLAINVGLRSQLKESQPVYEQSPLGAGFAWDAPPPQEKRKPKPVPTSEPAIDENATIPTATQPSTVPATQPTTEPTTEPSGFMQWLRRTLSE